MIKYFKIFKIIYYKISTSQLNVLSGRDINRFKKGEINGMLQLKVQIAARTAVSRLKLNRLRKSGLSVSRQKGRCCAKAAPEEHY